MELFVLTSSTNNKGNKPYISFTFHEASKEMQRKYNALTLKESNSDRDPIDVNETNRYNGIVNEKVELAHFNYINAQVVLDDGTSTTFNIFRVHLDLPL